MSAWLHIRAVRSPEQFDAWLHRLLVHACYREARRVRHRGIDPESTVDAPDAPGDPDAQELTAVRDLLERGFHTPDPRAARRPRRPLLPWAARRRGGQRPRHRGRDLRGPAQPRHDSASCRPRRRCAHADRWQGVDRMTAHDDFDRTLAGWFEADALSPVPVGGLERVADATRRRTPRPAWISRVGSDWVGTVPRAGSSTGAGALPSLRARWSKSRSSCSWWPWRSWAGPSLPVPSSIRPSPLPTGRRRPPRVRP